MEGDVDLAEATGSIVNSDAFHSTKDAAPRRVGDGVDNDVDDKKRGFDEAVSVDAHSENDGVAADDEGDYFNDDVESESEGCVDEAVNVDAHDEGDGVVADDEGDHFSDDVERRSEDCVEGSYHSDESDNPFPHPSLSCDDFDFALVKARSARSEDAWSTFLLGNGFQRKAMELEQDYELRDDNPSNDWRAFALFATS